MERTDPVHFAPHAKEVEKRLVLKSNSEGTQVAVFLSRPGHLCAGMPEYDLDRVRLANSAAILEVF